MYFSSVSYTIVTISHPWQRDTRKYAAQGPNIKSPEGHRVQLEASNMLPAGDIMWPVGGKFSCIPSKGEQN